ncbi:hypothetical protein JW890_04395 [candidate division WOR-3 bacterium]|nr:hypothetical protein [candidate division WOR-3 bacterium]
MDFVGTLIWCLILIAVLLVLLFPGPRSDFVNLTQNYPYPMGMLKFALLGTMGELISWKIITGKWRIRNIRIWQKILVWAFLGFLFVAVFPLFSFGVEGLMKTGLLAGEGNRFITAFWKSFFMQAIFAFPFMIFHRITDTLIDRGELFKKWKLIDVYKNIDWENMFKIVGAAIVWFWLPVHTANFLLPPEFRLITAALLAIVLGMILGIAKRISVKKKEALWQV